MNMHTCVADAYVFVASVHAYLKNVHAAKSYESLEILYFCILFHLNLYLCFVVPVFM